MNSTGTSPLYSRVHKELNTAVLTCPPLFSREGEEEEEKEEEEEEEEFEEEKKNLRSVCVWAFGSVPVAGM
jgi:hypothetical protein